MPAQKEKLYNNAILIYSMAWEESEYSKSEINGAGQILRNSSATETERADALKILDNWRGAHGYPMQVFYVRLHGVARKIDKNSLVSQRLKRVPSIIAKLNRKYPGSDPFIGLYRMQDIGGCRAVMPTAAAARALYKNYYTNGNLRHKKIRTTDYIDKPKSDGYRGIHIIYAYKSDKKNKERYDGLLIEIQIRSRLQHLWATAVETAGLFTKQAVKSNEGSPELLEFFRLVSSAFAKIENCPAVPNAPEDEKELYSRIREKERKLNIVSKMQGWAKAISVFNEAKERKGEVKFFLLELDIREKLIIRAYTKKEEQRALDEYAVLEKRHSGDREYDVVLVGVDAAKDLKKAYPNYFVDTNEFLIQLRKIINK